MTTSSTRDLIITGGCSWTADYVGFLNDKNPPSIYGWDDENKKFVETKYVAQTPFPVWPEIISKKLGLKLINTAKVGCGNDLIFHRVVDQIYQNADKVKLVVIAWTDYMRKDLQVYDERWYSCTFGPHADAKKKMFFTSLYKIGSLDSKSCINYFYRYALSLQEICKSLGIKLVQCQAIGPIKLHERVEMQNIGLDYTDVNFNTSNLNFLSHFVDHYGYDLVENSDTFIDWPIFKALGGSNLKTCLDRANVDYQISSYDQHPNHTGHQFIADKILEKINE